MYHMKILLGDFHAKVGRENIFQPTIGTKSIHPESNENCIRLRPHGKESTEVQITQNKGKGSENSY